MPITIITRDVNVNRTERDEAIQGSDRKGPGIIDTRSLCP
jgi:hypothetical protein